MEKDLAIVYDFDQTLSPRYMQAYGLLPAMELTEKQFGQKINKRVQNSNIDTATAYMQEILASAVDKTILTEQVLHQYGKAIEFFPGVTEWFHRINMLYKNTNHLVLSCGLAELIEGCKIGREFRHIYANRFSYDENSLAKLPTTVIGNNEKAAIMRQILSQYQVIYICDGLTDIDCLKICKKHDSYTIAVYTDKNTRQADKLLIDGLVDIIVPADFTKEGELYKLVCQYIANKEQELSQHESNHLL